MNCDRARDHILLTESGEIGRRAGARLARHLSGCSACRAFFGEYGRFTRAAAGFLQADGPGAAATGNVRSEIRRLARRPPVMFPEPARLLALAAGLLVAAAAAWLLVAAERSIARVRTVHAAVELLSEGAVATAGEPAAHAEALRALAMDMLVLEGLSAEPYAEADLFSQPEEPTATDPLSRSMSGYPEGTCG